MRDAVDGKARYNATRQDYTAQAIGHMAHSPAHIAIFTVCVLIQDEGGIGGGGEVLWYDATTHKLSLNFYDRWSRYHMLTLPPMGYTQGAVNAQVLLLLHHLVCCNCPTYKSRSAVDNDLSHLSTFTSSGFFGDFSISNDEPGYKPGNTVGGIWLGEMFRVGFPWAPVVLAVPRT